MAQDALHARIELPTNSGLRFEWGMDYPSSAGSSASVRLHFADAALGHVLEMSVHPAFPIRCMNRGNMTPVKTTGGRSVCIVGEATQTVTYTHAGLAYIFQAWTTTKTENGQRTNTTIAPWVLSAVDTMGS